MKTKFYYTVLTLLLISVFNLNYAQHHVYLEVPNSIPCYCQETNIWCGAATAQMILEGYPAGVEHPYTQTHIWNVIQAHKNDINVNWATDPDGLKDALMDLGGDPGVHWVIFAQGSAQNQMYSVSYWLNRRLYPAAVLIYGFAHWVTITGVTTDVDPTTSNSVNLQFIEYFDPWDPPCPSATSGGVKSWITGSAWYNIYYPETGYPQSKWNNNCIAIIEPPSQEGIAIAKQEVVKGAIISDSLALENAQMWIEKLGLFKRESYKVLSKAQLLAPLLVNRDSNGYYIVPLGYKESEYLQGAILINAYNGSFQEIGVFQKPIKYISKDDAIKAALNYTCFCKDDNTAELVFEPSEQTTSRFLPVWKVKLERTSWIFFKDEVTVFVNQEGKVFNKLRVLPLGD
jgi:hypothetical protein